MKKKEWACLIFLAMVTAAALLIGIGQIYVIGVDGERLWEPESVGLLLETAVLFGVFFLILKGAGCRSSGGAFCFWQAQSFRGCTGRSSRFSCQGFTSFF